MDNCLITSRRLLETLDIPFTQEFLKEKILVHPNYPSLLSISDTLEEYGVESMAVKLGPDRLDDFPLLGIVQVSGAGGTYFNTITDVTENSVSLYDEYGRQKELPRLDFLKSWTGVGMFVEAREDAGEPGIRQKIRHQRIIQGISLVGAAGLLLWLSAGIAGQEVSGLILFYFLLKLLGLVISGLLLWYRQDQDNPALQQFCTGGRQVDCNEVLNSEVFQWLGGRVNPGVLAFAYFFAGFGLLAGSAFSSSITFLAWLSAATVPVVVYSFYYQAMVIKKWCRFCLLIQGVLALEVLTVLAGAFWEGEFSVSAFSLFLFLFTGAVLGGVLIKPLLGLRNEVYSTKRELAKLKSNKKLFDAALSGSRKIENEPRGLGIIMKGEKPEYSIIKVCNPYCGPCSRVHPILESLFKKGNIDLQILFTPGAGDGQKEKTIRHLLAIAGKGNPIRTHQALDDWYGAEKKDYQVFASKYPMNGELLLQEEKIKQMEDWCAKESISHTPTLFINGYELPKEYSVEDLKYVLE